MTQNDIPYLHHIVDAIARIEEYLQGVAEDDFHHTKQISKDLQDRYPQIPWQDIAGMRDKLIHHYFGVNMEEVWLTAREDIPVLK